MKHEPLPFLVEMERMAHLAQREELAFRDGIARELARLERERQFAFRRLELARSMAIAAEGAESEEAAVSRQIAALVAQFGWYSEGEQRQKILAAWTPVAVAVWKSAQAPATSGVDDHSTFPKDPAAVLDAIRAFEVWYEREIGQPFLAILDHEMPEIPVVEF